MPTRILSPLLKTGILTALATALITVAPYSMAVSYTHLTLPTKRIV